jgi:hypothetical protein
MIQPNTAILCVVCLNVAVIPVITGQGHACMGCAVPPPEMTLPPQTIRMFDPDKDVTADQRITRHYHLLAGLQVVQAEPEVDITCRFTLTDIERMKDLLALAACYSGPEDVSFINRITAEINTKLMEARGIVTL